MLALPAPSRAGIKAALAIAAGLVRDYLTAIPRRLGDRLFAMNDTEAYWRGWQIIKLQSGLARRYRDPAFDTLVTACFCDLADEDIEEVS